MSIVSPADKPALIMMCFYLSSQANRRGHSVSSESQLSSLDGRRSVDGGADLAAENADLKRQVTWTGSLYQWGLMGLGASK